MPRFLIGRAPAMAAPIVAIVLAVAPCTAQVVIPADTTAVAPLQAVAPPAPVDEVLAAACTAGGGVAEDLLLVVFRPGTEPASQEAAARSVGGTLTGVDARGAYYLKAPAGGEAGLNALADRVIQHEAVEMVGPAECPPAPAVPASPGPPVSPVPPIPLPPQAPADTAR